MRLFLLVACIPPSPPLNWTICLLLLTTKMLLRYVLWKERNMLHTEREYAKSKRVLMRNPARINKVQKSMARLKLVWNERMTVRCPATMSGYVCTPCVAHILATRVLPPSNPHLSNIVICSCVWCVCRNGGNCTTQSSLRTYRKRPLSTRLVRWWRKKQLQFVLHRFLKYEYLSDAHPGEKNAAVHPETQ